MTRHTPRLYTVSLEPCRNIIIPQPAVIEPVLQRRHRPVMFKCAPVPDAMQGRYLVVTGAAPGLQSQTGIGFNRTFRISYLRQMLFRNFEAGTGSSLLLVYMAAYGRRRSLLSKNLSSLALSRASRRVRIRRRLQRVQVQRERIELFVTKAFLSRAGGNLENSPRRSE